MTTRTVEYTEEVQKSEEVNVCNECGLGDDATARGDLKEYVPLHGTADPLHYHEQCLADISDVDYEPDTIRGEIDQRTRGGRIYLAFDGFDLAFLIAGLAIAAMAILVAPASAGAGLAIGAFAVLVVGLSFVFASMNMKKPIYKADD